MSLPAPLNSGRGRVYTNPIKIQPRIFEMIEAYITPPLGAVDVAGFCTNSVLRSCGWGSVWSKI